MKTYGIEIQKAAQEIINAHKANGLNDDEAKQAAIVSVTFILTKGGLRSGFITFALYQKVYNHLTGIICPYH